MSILKAAAALAVTAISLFADVVVDLKTGIVTETFANTTNSPVSSAGPNYTTGDSYARVNVTKKASGCTTTPHEALVEVNLSPSGGTPITRLSVTVEYEGKPSGWTTHLGDDVDNDGFGGGTSVQGVAEAHTIGETFYVYSTGLAVGSVEKVIESKLRLTEGALHFNVSDQKLTFGQPYTVLDSGNLKQLFDLTGSTADKKLYLGFNRVINYRADRVGCGARRVILAFEN
jgi:hypothetical protein